MDNMGDHFLHDIVKKKNDTDDDTQLLSLTKKIQDQLNNDYWPSYLFKARLIPLSKDNKSYTTEDNVRTISVIPAITKLMERILLNRIE